MAKMADDHIRVALRIRPLLVCETSKGCKSCLNVPNGEPQVQISGTEKSFRFNHVFPPNAEQEDFYNTAVKHMIPKIFEGFNVTILAYGQTGSGKTHTMGTNFKNQGNHGILPRAIKDIFETIEKEKNEYTFEVHSSFLELYNEQLYDLLANKERSKSVVDIRENSIVNLTEKLVHNEEETLKWLAEGALARATGSTAMNEQSSRSHAVFTITVYQKHVQDEHKSKMAKFHFVDLAGSERSKKTQATGDRFKEGVNINKGLLALGNVISQLGEGNPTTYVNYRDSKLTRLLQDSLGGNSMTLMIACVSPADYNLEETVSTLRYADRARKIKNKPVVNQDPKSAEILMLRNKIIELESTMGFSCPPEHDELQRKLILSTAKRDQVVLQMIALREKIHSQEEIVEKYNVEVNNLLTNWEEFMKANPELSGRLQTFHYQILEMKNKVEENSTTLEISLSSSTEVDNITSEDKMLLQETYNVEHDEHLERQEECDRQMRMLDKVLEDKEKMMRKLTEDVSSSYIKNVRDMEREMNKLQEEKASLQSQLSDLKVNEKTSKLAEVRRKKIQELEKKISEMKRKCTDYVKVMKEKENGDKRIQQLRNEIQSLKQSKVKCVKDMRAEANKFQKWKLERERELIKVKAHERKLNFEMAKMQTQNQKKDIVYKRKMEESQAQNKRLKEALEKRENALKQRNARLNAKKKLNEDEVQLKISEQIDDMQHKLQVRKELKKKLKDREHMNQLQEQISKSKNPANEKDKKFIEKLKNDLKECNAEIESLQKELLASDEECAIESIYSSIIEAGDQHKAVRVLLQFLKKNYETIEEDEEENHEEEVVSEDEKISLEEQLAVHNKKMDELKEKIAASKPKVQNNRVNELLEVSALESSVEDNFEDNYNKDPDWRKTPLFKRVQNMHRRSTINSRVLAFKRSFDGESLCKCKTDCRTRLCSCKKVNGQCGPSCGCNPGKCLNRNPVKQNLFNDKESDDSNSDENTPKRSKFSTSSENLIFEIPKR